MEPAAAESHAGDQLLDERMPNQAPLKLAKPGQTEAAERPAEQAAADAPPAPKQVLSAAQVRCTFISIFGALTIDIQAHKGSACEQL